jgi:hypothetical protein
VGRRPGAAGIARRRRLGWTARGRRKERGEGEADRRALGVSAAGGGGGGGGAWVVVKIITASREIVLMPACIVISLEGYAGHGTRLIQICMFIWLPSSNLVISLLGSMLGLWVHMHANEDYCKTHQ